MKMKKTFIAINLLIGLFLLSNAALAQTTTIFAPDGTVTVCTVGQNIIICV
jgi:hypothetical protein